MSTALILGTSAIAAVIVAIAWRAAKLEAGNAVSSAWVQAHRQQGDRIEYHGPRITLPIDKRANELGWVNRVRLRRSA